MIINISPEYFENHFDSRGRKQDFFMENYIFPVSPFL